MSSTSKSIYGAPSNKKPIYGINNTVNKCNTNLCSDMFPLDTYLNSLKSTVGVLISVIDKLFPNITAQAPITGSLGAVTQVPPIMFCRLIWAHKNPGDVFTNTELQIIQLKQIFLQYGLDWRADPYIPK